MSTDLGFLHLWCKNTDKEAYRLFVCDWSEGSDKVIPLGYRINSIWPWAVLGECFVSIIAKTEWSYQ